MASKKHTLIKYRSC